jgi:hypothetical protein
MDGMTGDAPDHHEMVDLAIKHIGTGTRRSHQVLSFMRNPLTAFFFAKGLRNGRALAFFEYRAQLRAAHPCTLSVAGLEGFKIPIYRGVRNTL